MMKDFDQLRYKQIRKITTEDVIRTLNRFAENHSQDAVSRCRTVWHQIFQTAQMKEIPVIDRTLAIKTPRSKVPAKPRSMSCTYEDVMVTLENLETYGDGTRAFKRSKDLHDIILVMFYTGMRPQEALALCHKSVNLEKGEIYIFQSIGSTKTEYRQVIPTKTEDSIRPVPIAEGLRPLLEELVKRDTDLFFLDKDGKPYEVAVLGTMLLNMRKKRKLPRVTMYMCRHLFATDVYSKATNKKAAQTLMGHKSESMTLHYVYDDEEEKQDLVLNRKLS
jgi:integrase